MESDSCPCSNQSEFKPGKLSNILIIYVTDILITPKSTRLGPILSTRDKLLCVVLLRKGQIEVYDLLNENGVKPLWSESVHMCQNVCKRAFLISRVLVGYESI